MEDVAVLRRAGHSPEEIQRSAADDDRLEAQTAGVGVLIERVKRRASVYEVRVSI